MVEEAVFLGKHVVEERTDSHNLTSTWTQNKYKSSLEILKKANYKIDMA